MTDVHGRQGMVAAARPASADAGLAMLRDGGNAVDAAVAAAATECAVAPADNGFGGYGGSMMIYLAEEDRRIAVDYNTRAPEAADNRYFECALDETDERHIGHRLRDLDWSGYRLIGVPGTVAGLGLALTRFGTKSWREALQPAIDAIAHGVEVNPTLRGSIRSGLEGILASDEAQGNLLRNGKVPEVGDVVPMASFRRFVQRLADEGPGAFYDGPMTESIVSHVRDHGGILSRDDLAGYEAREVTPLTVTYRGHAVCTTPLANGGASVLQILNLLEGFDVASLREKPLEYIDLLISTYRLAWQDRLSFFGDPAQIHVDIDRVLSKAYSGETRAKLPPRKWEDGSNSTIHVSAIDGNGNMAALTQTMGGGMPGSLNFVPELGLILNHGMVLFDPRPDSANGVAPGKQPLNNMCPTLIFRKRQPMYSLGSPGARKIVSAVTQMIVNLIDFGLGVSESIARPRLHCEDAGPIEVERSFPEEVRAELEKRGRRIELVGKVAGPAHAIRIENDGLTGATDPRGSGKVAAL